MSRRRNHKGGSFTLDAHAHAQHQIIVPDEGIAQISVEGEGSYFITRGQGIFVAAGHGHEGKMSGVLSIDNLYLDKVMCSESFCTHSFVFRVTELFLAVLSTLKSKPAWTEKSAELDALCLILCKEMSAAREDDAFLPMPKNPQLYTIALQLRAHPAAFTSIDDIANTLQISTRHFRRLFRKECGLNFSQWLAKVRLMMAKEMLAANEAISNIALEIGFHEFASFSRFFKKATGMSPRAWAQRLRG